MALIASSALLRGILLLLIFEIVFGIAVLFFRAGNKRLEVRQELKVIAAAGPGFRNVQSLHARRDDAFSRLVDRIERAGLNLGDTKSDVLRAKLVAAGFESPTAPKLYTLIRLVLVIVMPCLVVGLTLMSADQLSFMRLYFYGSIASLLGLFVPSMILSSKTDRRKQAILNGFPDSLDLMLVCVEAGLGLEAALDRVGREVTVSAPLVAQLLTTATLQLRAGASRESALRRMADTAGIDEIRSFSTLLIQSDKLGSSIGAALRIYATEMRDKRRMRAEEKAHRIPVLISIPLVACLLPVMIGVLMLPVSVQVVRHMLPAMNGK